MSSVLVAHCQGSREDEVGVDVGGVCFFLMNVMVQTNPNRQYQPGGEILKMSCLSFTMSSVAATACSLISLRKVKLEKLQQELRQALHGFLIIPASGLRTCR